LPVLGFGAFKHQFVEDNQFAGWDSDVGLQAQVHHSAARLEHGDGCSASWDAVFPAFDKTTRHFKEAGAAELSPLRV
jgi:hypothetical protein